MALTAKQLTRSLEDKTVRLLGPPDAEIYMVKRWDKNEPDSPPGILYVAAPGQSEHVQGSVILTGESEIESVKLQIQKTIVRDYQAGSALVQLTQAVNVKTPMDRIAEICYKIMDNSVFFFNEHLSLTASCHGEEMKNFLPAVLSRKDTDMNTHTVFLPSNENCPVNAVAGPIRHGKELIGYLLVIAWEELDKEIAGGYFNLARSILSGRTSLDDSAVQPSEKQQFIFDLLKHGAFDVQAARERMRELNIPASDKYFVLSIRMDNDRDSFFLSSPLQSLLKTEVYEYDHYYIAVIGCPIKQKITDQTYPKLLPFLQQHNLYAGLSNGFLDFASLKQAFEQSTTAISLRTRVSETRIRFCRYEDQILSHLIDMAHQRGMHYELFCHPNVVYIKRYDEKHGTEYLKTLMTYVFNTTQHAITANKLFIHRNTLYHRVNTLKEEFGIDFENPRELMKLRISCTAYGFMGKMEHVEDLFGPLN